MIDQRLENQIIISKLEKRIHSEMASITQTLFSLFLYKFQHHTQLLIHNHHKNRIVSMLQIGSIQPVSNFDTKDMVNLNKNRQKVLRIQFIINFIKFQLLFMTIFLLIFLIRHRLIIIIMINFEVRKFFPRLHNQIKINEDQALIDIYVHQKGHSLIGVKFREPKRKQYGWKLNNFQCKIATIVESKDEKGVYLQGWRKFYFDLESPIKLKIVDKQLGQQDFQHDREQKIEENNQKEVKQLTTHDKQAKLSKKVGKIFRAVAKILTNPKVSEIFNNDVVKNWCMNSEKQHKILDNFQMYLIVKKRMKVKGLQYGQIKIERLIHKSEALYFQTECYENTNQKKVLGKTKQWKQNNVSYPKLLQSIMTTMEKTEPKL